MDYVFEIPRNIFSVRIHEIYFEYRSHVMNVSTYHIWLASCYVTCIKNLKDISWTEYNNFGLWFLGFTWQKPMEFADNSLELNLLQNCKSMEKTSDSLEFLQRNFSQNQGFCIFPKKKKHALIGHEGHIFALPNTSRTQWTTYLKNIFVLENFACFFPWIFRNLFI